MEWISGFGGRVALVTGASAGIGMAIARRLALEGARVALGYRSAPKPARTLASALEAEGCSAPLIVSLELGRPASVKEAVASVVDRWNGRGSGCKRLGVSRMVAADARMEHSSDDVWHSQLRTNVEGTVATIKAVLPHMRERGWGRMVLLSSGAAQDGSPGMEAYATAKAAIGGLTLSLARSTGPSGVLVNAVLPGLVATERHKRTIPEEALAQIAQRTPTRRLTSEEDVAKLTAFLASNANQSVTGASIRISGGLRM